MTNVNEDDDWDHDTNPEDSGSAIQGSLAGDDGNLAGSLLWIAFGAQ